MGPSQGTDRDRESQSTMVLNVLLPDSSLLSGDAQQRTPAPVSLPDPLVYFCYWMTFLESLDLRAP